MKRGDLVYEAPYPERGIVVKILKGGAVRSFQKNTQISWWW